MQQPIQPSVFDKIERSATELSKLYVPVRDVFDLNETLVPNPLAKFDVEASSLIKFRSFRKMLDRYVAEGKYVEFSEAANTIFSVLDHQFGLARRRHDAYIEKLESYVSSLIEGGQYSELRANEAESQNKRLIDELTRLRSSYRDALRVLNEIKGRGDQYLFVKNYNSALQMVDSARASILDGFDALREKFVVEHGKAFRSAAQLVPDFGLLPEPGDQGDSDGSGRGGDGPGSPKKSGDDDEPDLSEEELEELKKKYRRIGPPKIFDEIMEANN